MIDFIPVCMAKADTKLVWGRENAPDLYGYQVSGSGRFIGRADRYACGGSGRSVLINGASLKGCGATPFAQHGIAGYDDGQLVLREAVKEAVYLSCIHSVYSDAIPAIAVLRTGEMTPIKLGVTESEWYQLPFARRFDHGAILVRGFPVRLANYSHQINTADGALADIMHRYGVTDDSYKFASRMVWQFADRAAFWWVRRVDFGAVMSDNIDIFGNPFDVATTTIKPDFRNTFSCAWKKPFWAGITSSTSAAAHHIADNFLPIGTPEQAQKAWAATTQQATAAIYARLRVHLLTLTGFTVAEAERLFSENAAQAGALAQAIFKYLKAGTNVAGMLDGDEPHDGDWRIVRVPHIGSDFRATFRALSRGEHPADLAAAEIAERHQQAAAYLGFRDAWEGNCAAINANISGVLRSVPELEFTYQKIAFGSPDWEADVSALMDKAITLFSNTAGRKPE